MPDDAPGANLTSIWRRVTDELGRSLPASTFQLWIKPLRPLAVRGASLYVAAPQATSAWVERRYGSSLEAALRASEAGLDRVVIVREGAEPAGTDGRWTTAVESLPLNPGHSFERFVIGDGNRLAHAAALAVAELPGDAYNPLFLHGPPGLGKTHLLGAIGDYLRRHRPDLSVHYTTAERFTTEFVSALQRQGPERFKERYRGLDALLIDDVQTLEGKEQTQEEFVHTFNALHAGGKQIVLSSDRPPKALARLAERLRDRFQWGLCSELGLPDLRTRTTLLWRIAAGGPIELPDPGAIREIASLAAGNVRQLEGAMTRVIALSSVLGEPVTAELVHKALADRKPGREAGGQLGADAPSLEAIQEATCAVFELSRADLLSPKRTSRVTQARQLAIYLARDLTSLSLAQIARGFNRDHSTVLYATRAVSSRLEVNSETTISLERIRGLIRTQPQGPGASDISAHGATLHPQSPSTSATLDPLS
ncbi:MAG TPA: chromosomal replication initiator protein DnaA [Solirubrobacterales bacterium]